ncbi:MAG: hypothetical protein HYT36_00025 [Candidatus Staskawiczbacteria bacterium]|nr:hypothetical protein [Candidatus Staskawiczbacteria bacterium]
MSKKTETDFYTVVIILISLLFLAFFNIDKEKITARNSQIKNYAKAEPSCRIISFTELPCGDYSRIEDENFAFVKRETKNPEEQKIFAVRHSGKIPQRFIVKETPKKYLGQKKEGNQREYYSAIAEQ